jgi:hypothetical protein
MCNIFNVLLDIICHTGSCEISTVLLHIITWLIISSLTALLYLTTNKWNLLPGTDQYNSMFNRIDNSCKNQSKALVFYNSPDEMGEETKKQNWVM